MREEIKINSVLGIISTVIASLAGAIVFTVIFAAAYLEFKTPGIADDDSVAEIIGILIVLPIAGNLLGLIIGIIGFFEKNKSKLFAIIGTAMNSLIILIIAGIIIFGLVID